jgi:nicotinate dehydrogenase large molybdopterin subunit
MSNLPKSEPASGSAVGLRNPRMDTIGQVTGEMQYVEDLKRPGMLHAKILRAAHPHARILELDISSANACPGVKAVVTAADIPVNKFGPTFQDQPVIAADKVRHLGDAVAAVAAETEAQAEEALEKIRVAYEPLPGVFDPIEAMDQNATRVHEEKSNIYVEWHIQKGNVQAALERSHLVIEGRYTTQMVEHAAIEPHASLAYWKRDGRLIIWSTLGRITLARSDIGKVLGIPLNRIKVACTQVGGNFGGKNEITLEPIVAMLAKKSGRPVRGAYSRKDEFVSSTTRHPFILDYTTGVDKEGFIQGRKIRLVAEGGAYCSWSLTTLGKATILSAGPYRMENLSADGFAVYTNRTPAGAMRGFGGPQVCFAYESHLDEIAHALKMNPLEIRLKNVLREGDKSPTGQPLYSVGAANTMETAAERFGWKGSQS